MTMNRYYVEFRVDDGQGHCENYYFYVYAYSKRQVCDIFSDHEILSINRREKTDD